MKMGLCKFLTGQLHPLPSNSRAAESRVGMLSACAAQNRAEARIRTPATWPCPRPSTTRTISTVSPAGATPPGAGMGKTEKNDARFPEFLESLKEAEAGFIESNLGVIRRAATESSVTKREHIRGTTPKGPRKSSKSGRGVVCGPARSPSICDGWNSRDGTDSKTTATPQQNHITQELTPATIRQRTRRNNGRTNDNFGVIR